MGAGLLVGGVAVGLGVTLGGGGLGVVGFVFGGAAVPLGDGVVGDAELVGEDVVGVEVGGGGRTVVTAYCTRIKVPPAESPLASMLHNVFLLTSVTRYVTFSASGAVRKR